MNRATPELAAAERHAQSALALVPYWHYVRDILLPQIRKGKEQGDAPTHRELGLSPKRMLRQGEITRVQAIERLVAAMNAR